LAALSFSLSLSLSGCFALSRERRDAFSFSLERERDRERRERLRERERDFLFPLFRLLERSFSLSSLSFGIASAASRADAEACDARSRWCE
jgi:hypothetical protein